MSPAEKLKPSLHPSAHISDIEMPVRNAWIT